MEPPQTTSTPLIRLAVLRVLVGGVIFGAADVWRAPLLAIEHADAASALRAVVLLSCALVVVGLWTRPASVVMAVASAILIGLIQEQGTPLHVHHLAWLAALIAVSPAGRVWSIDAWLTSRRSGSNTPAATLGVEATAAELTLRWACLLLAFVYFFPGVHKIVDDSSPFTDPSSLVRLVRLKALEAGRDVFLGLDAFPTALLVGGFFVVAGEILVLAAALWTPRLGLLLVVFIHAAIAAAMSFSFSVLAIFAVVFLLPTSSGPGALVPRTNSWRILASAAVGLILVVGVAGAGLLGDTHGYPFASYPTFSQPVPEHVRVLSVAADDGTGALTTVPHDALVPPDLRTPVIAASRLVHTAHDARRFIAWRQADPRFLKAVWGARSVRVSVANHDLSSGVADPPFLVVDVVLHNVKTGPKPTVLPSRASAAGPEQQVSPRR